MRHFDHLAFVAPAYALFLAVAGWLALGAARRLARATARLAAVDRRGAAQEGAP